MSADKIHDPASLLNALGDLHDVRVERLELDPDERQLVLVTDDLNANFESLPGDPGRRPCTLIFRGVSAFTCDVETQEGMRIDNAEIVLDGPKFKLEVDLNLGGGSLTRGRRSIVATFEELYVRQS